MDTIKALREYNRWRRGENDDNEEVGPHPKELGEQIDAAIAELEAGRLLFEAAENLRKQRGRHNTELAYQRLVEQVQAYKLRTPNGNVTGAEPVGGASGGRSC